MEVTRRFTELRAKVVVEPCKSGHTPQISIRKLMMEGIVMSKRFCVALRDRTLGFMIGLTGDTRHDSGINHTTSAQRATE